MQLDGLWTFHTLLALSSLAFGNQMSNDPLAAPRIFISFKELRSTATAHHFAYLLNTSDYRILRMDEDHDRMYVGSKDHILSLDLHDINKDPHIIHWPVSERRRMECLVSGKDANEECANFIRLIEPWNRTQLYVCGTGAYNPVCTFVNRGRKPQAHFMMIFYIIKSAVVPRVPIWQSSQLHQPHQHTAVVPCELLKLLCLVSTFNGTS